MRDRQAGKLQRRAWALVAAAVVLVLLAASGVLVTRTDGQPEAAARAIGTAVRGGAKGFVPTQARPTPAQPAPPVPSASPTPPASLPGTPADFSALVAEVAAVRGLAPQRPVAARVLAPADLAAKVASLDFGEDDPLQIEADRRLLASLRLIPDDLDLLGFVRDLYAEQVLGLYVPEEETLYVGTANTTLTPYEEITAAHEITHALQDQAFDLESLQDLPTAETDASLALLALVEGDAVLTQQIWQARNQTAAERADALADVGGGPNDALRRAPPYLRAALSFPYVEGAAFVSTLLSQGGFAAVDAAYAAPPSTTEQIIHPERYTADEPRVPVALTGTPGADWTQSTESAFGEFDVRELLAPLGERAAADLAAGWGGGQVVAWQRAGPDGVQDATAVWLAFDTPADAADVCAAVPAWYEAAAGGQQVAPGVYTSQRDVLVLHCDGLVVRSGLAPDEAAARLIAGA